MDIALDDVEVRVLGCLIEKELTTPDYYPMTLNAITNACNQKSNRDPVASYEETTVVQGLDGLRKRGLALIAQTDGGRVPKYRHFLVEKFGLVRKELAVLCELMLRGPQTVGEIRARGSRMYGFEDLEEADATMLELAERGEPWVVKLPRQAGRKECRYMHLLSGMPRIEENGRAVSTEAVGPDGQTDDERVARLEKELETLRCDFESLKRAFIELKSQLE
jgi:uncharacterized protein YceH (UPF0502 family)